MTCVFPAVFRPGDLRCGIGRRHRILSHCLQHPFSLPASSSKGVVVFAILTQPYLSKTHLYSIITDGCVAAAFSSNDVFSFAFSVTGGEEIVWILRLMSMQQRVEDVNTVEPDPLGGFPAMVASHPWRRGPAFGGVSPVVLPEHGSKLGASMDLLIGSSVMKGGQSQMHGDVDGLMELIKLFLPYYKIIKVFLPF